MTEYYKNKFNKLLFWRLYQLIMVYTLIVYHINAIEEYKNI